AKRGDSAILVQLPGYSNPEKAKELLGKTAQLEFKIADDEDRSVTQLKDLPPGITLDWDRYEGAGGALVTSPYLRAKDGLELRKFVQGKAPPGKEFGIQKVEERIARETYYRTYMLDRKAGMTGEYITDARIAFDNSPGEGNRPYGQVSFNRTGAHPRGALGGGVAGAGADQARLAGGAAGPVRGAALHGRLLPVQRSGGGRRAGPERHRRPGRDGAARLDAYPARHRGLRAHARH